jgi:hypothetical protein
MAAEDVFRKIAGARASAGGNWIKPGRYLHEVQNILVETKDGGNTFIAELLVREAAQTEPAHNPNVVGSQVSYVQMLDRHKSAVGNAKAFVLALVGATEEDLAGDDFVELLEYATNIDPKAKNAKGETIPVQPLRGYHIACETYFKGKKSKPSDIMTLPKWTTSPNNQDEVVLARRALQEGKPAA